MKREPDNSPQIERLAITVPEAGQALGLGRSGAYQAARRKQIPTVRVGRRLLVPLAALERMLEATPGTLTNVGTKATSAPEGEDDR